MSRGWNNIIFFKVFNLEVKNEENEKISRYKRRKVDSIFLMAVRVVWIIAQSASLNDRERERERGANVARGGMDVLINPH